MQLIYCKHGYCHPLRVQIFCTVITEKIMPYYKFEFKKIYLIVKLQMWQCYFKSILLDISVFSFTVPHEFHDILHRYTIQGYRVIALAHKKMDPKLTWHQAQRISR